MYTQEPVAKSRANEPDLDNPSPERRRKRKRSLQTDNPESNPPRDHPSPKPPHNPQDIPEQELQP